MNRRCSTYFLFFCLLALLSALSCNKKASNTRRFKIGVSQCSNDLWRNTMNEEMLLESRIYKDLDVAIKTSLDNTEQQIKDIQQLIDNKVDLLIISPNESQGLTEIVQEAYNKGIPTILIDRKTETDRYSSFVGADNEQIGREVGNYVAALLKGKGNILVMRGLAGSTSDAERYKGFQEIISTYPNLSIVAEPHANFFEVEAEKQMHQVMDTINKPIDVIFALNDPMAYGASKALDNYSGRKKPYIIGIDALPGEGGGLELIQKGIIDASFIYPTGGDKVITLARNILQGLPYNKNNKLNTAVVTKDNLTIMQMQNEQLEVNQKKLENLNLSLDESLTQYASQKKILYAFGLFSLLIILMLLQIYWAYRGKTRAVRQLKLSNKEIKSQAELLQEQKDQLIDLTNKLEEATQEKLVFFTNISHELKTPLTLILGPIESLRQNNNLNADERQLADLIYKNALHLSRLIGQIIEFRTLENNKLKFNYSWGDFSSFMADLNNTFLDYSRRKEVDFDLQVDHEDWQVYFDKDKVEKIYFNILSNAFKHTPGGGIIRVNLKVKHQESNPTIKIDIFNSGKAIPKDELQRIFDRFYKLNPHDSGTGIGLAYTISLIKLLDGEINVMSEENKGTTFSVILPYLKHVSPELIDSKEELYNPSIPEFVLSDVEPIKNEEDNIPDQEKDTILIIEDNEDVRTYIKTILGTKYNIEESENGKEGIEKAIEITPDLIISDVMMPQKDGLEVCKSLKENLSTSHIPIILLTACSLDEQKAQGFESGADAYIPKPFNAHLLSIRVRKTIENRRKIKEAFHTDLVNDTRKISLEKAEQEFISNFEDFIEENIADSQLSVDEVANHLGLSKSQMYRKIKSLTDLSPNEYIRLIRLRRSKEILSKTSKSVSEVAYEVGFSSPSYFTKCFKDLYNTSPTEYIEQLR